MRHNFKKIALVPSSLIMVGLILFLVLSANGQWTKQINTTNTEQQDSNINSATQSNEIVEIAEEDTHSDYDLNNEENSLLIDVKKLHDAEKALSWKCSRQQSPPPKTKPTFNFSFV